jgi:hypothetical protein
MAANPDGCEMTPTWLKLDKFEFEMTSAFAELI